MSNKKLRREARYVLRVWKIIISKYHRMRMRLSAKKRNSQRVKKHFFCLRYHNVTSAVFHYRWLSNLRPSSLHLRRAIRRQDGWFKRHKRYKCTK